MEYTYEIENKNGKYLATIIYTTVNSRQTHGKILSTEAEAETWATTAIQAMKDNNNVFVNVEG
jgi:hypothetical protein